MAQDIQPSSHERKALIMSIALISLLSAGYYAITGDEYAFVLWLALTLIAVI